MFETLPSWLNAAIFLGAAVVVWIAGTRVARYADAIQRRTGVGEAVIGMLLLGLVTALPELSVTVTAASSGNPDLAVNNLLGGMALNIAILASADAAIRREALTSAVASATPLLQGALLMLLLAIVAGATVVGDHLVLGIGIWAWLILATYLLGVLVVRSSRGDEAWVPDHHATRNRGEDHRPGGERPKTKAGGNRTVAPLFGKTALGAVAILVAGFAIAESGNVLAERTGLGQSFFGAVFLALTTSLPEISIVFSSVRIGRYAMAVSDIFGANLFGLALLFVVDAVYPGEPVLAHAGRFATFAALLAIAITALFVAALLERRHVMILRMGSDSLLVIAAYLGGVTVLYTLR